MASTPPAATVSFLPSDPSEWGTYVPPKQTTQCKTYLRVIASRSKNTTKTHQKYYDEFLQWSSQHGHDGIVNPNIAHDFYQYRHALKPFTYHDVKKYYSAMNDLYRRQQALLNNAILLTKSPKKNKALRDVHAKLAAPNSDGSALAVKQVTQTEARNRARETFEDPRVGTHFVDPPTEEDRRKQTEAVMAKTTYIYQELRNHCAYNLTWTGARIGNSLVTRFVEFVAGFKTLLVTTKQHSVPRALPVITDFSKNNQVL